MLIKRYKSFSGFFQFQKGKLQYINSKENDFFEIDTTFVQALQIQEENHGDNIGTSRLNIIGNFQVIKSIILPTQFAKDAKYWIYLHLHFLGREDAKNCHHDVQPTEVVQYKRSQKIRSFCLITVCILLFAGLSRSITYSYQIGQLKTEAKYLKVPELLIESKNQADRSEFNESIHSLLLANAIKPSPNIRILLDEAYFKRGNYYLSIGNIPYAKQDFLHIKSLKSKTVPILLKIEKEEEKFWLRFSDFVDLIQFSWDTFKSNLDHGKNHERSEELSRTWAEFQTKLDYTRNYHPLWGGIKEFFIDTVY